MSEEMTPAEALSERVAALTAELERLRKIIATDAIRFDILAGRARACEKGAISEGHPLSVQEGEWWAEDCRAALALPTNAPEAKE